MGNKRIATIIRIGEWVPSQLLLLWTSMLYQLIWSTNDATFATKIKPKWQNPTINPTFDATLIDPTNNYRLIPTHEPTFEVCVLFAIYIINDEMFLY